MYNSGMAKNPRLIDMSGQRFGRWLVLKQAGNDARGGALWLCLGDGGSEKVVVGPDLRFGKSLSCGCASSRTTFRARITTHGMTGSRLHICWKNMLARCRDKTNNVYGGKGISVCNEWLKFANFHEWAMRSGYADNLTIDRIDNDLGYSPTNCKWSNRTEQARNRTIVRLAGDGRSWAEIAEAHGVPVTIMNNRIAAGGWSPERAATTPVGSKRQPMPRDAGSGRFILKSDSDRWRR